MRLAAVAFICFLAAACLASALSEIARAKFVQPAADHMRSDYQRYWPTVAVDLQAARALTQVTDERAQRCEALDRLPWTESDGTLLPGGDQAFALPEAAVTALKQAKAAWGELDPSVAAGVDFSWMRSLRRCDRWEVWAAIFARTPHPVSTMGARGPAFQVLQSWTKLRLLRGLQEGDLAEASGDVQHLAALCLSTNEQLGTMIGATLLAFDADFRSLHGGPTGQKDPRAFEELRRASLAASFAAHVLLEPAEVERVLSDTDASPLRCLASAQAAWLALPYKKALARRRAGQLEVIGRHLLANEARCHLEPLAHAWRGDAPEYEVVGAIEASNLTGAVGIFRLLAPMPVVGATGFESSAAIVTPTGYNLYKPKDATATVSP